jgi:rubredoxin
LKADLYPVKGLPNAMQSLFHRGEAYLTGIDLVKEYAKGGDHMASWKCGNCGYTFEADTPPDQCPSCKEKCEFLDNTCYTPDCPPGGVDPRIK